MEASMMRLVFFWIEPDRIVPKDNISSTAHDVMTCEQKLLQFNSDKTDGRSP